MSSFFITLFLCFIGGVIASLIINVLLLRFSQTLGIRNKNDVTIRWSNQSKPSLGGVSFFIVFLFSSILFTIFDRGDNIFHDRKFVVLFAGGVLSFVMGLADDAYNTRPKIKLLVQILCGVLLCAGGSVINLTPNVYLNMFITVFWVVLLMNSLNMLDNMDGITGTVSFFILLSCQFSMFYISGFTFTIWQVVNIAVIGGIIGFLVHNINPSKLFMGDAGSQFIGFFVAFMSLEFLFNRFNISTDLHVNWQAIVLIVIAFTAPFTDTLSVVISRLGRGISPMVGGKDHTTHHLVYKGCTDREVWYVFLLISFFSFLFSVYLIFNGDYLAPYLWLVLLLYPICVFLRLFFIMKKYKEPSTKV